MSRGAEPRKLNEVKGRLKDKWSEGVAPKQPPEEGREDQRSHAGTAGTQLPRCRGYRLQPGSQCWGPRQRGGGTGHQGASVPGGV